MKQCMDSANLHRRLAKIIGQIQAIDRMVDEDIPCEDILAQIQSPPSTKPGKWCLKATSNTVSATGSNTAMRMRP